MSMTIAKKFKQAHKYYGQLVIGPPGSGKTTYCEKISKFLKSIHRNVVVVNLDPANDCLFSKPDIDIKELVSLEEVMDQYKLGPNGALLYCIEYLEKNIDWLHERIDELNCGNSTNFLFDLPGQIELYCHHESLTKICQNLTSRGYFQVCVVHLIDSHHCSDAGKFISALILSLNAMLKIGLPHINLLTKLDLLKKHVEKLQFGIDYYTEVLDLNYLLDCLDTDKFTNKYKKLNSALVSIVEDYSLVTFQPVNLLEQESLLKVKNLVDKANGYVFKSEEGRSINSMLACAMGVTEPINVHD